jgi:hypothetical protein
VYRDFAARGFALPAGTVVSEVAKAREAMRNAASTLNRDVMIKQAELEQSNRRFALEQAWQVESGLITYTSQMAQRSFEAAKYLVEAAIEVYKAQVTEYNAEVEAFRVRAQVYETRLRGEIAKLDIYKAEIEGQKLITDLNDQSVRVYTAQLQAVNTMVQVFETEVRAASVQADINRSIIEQFRARVQAYAEQVRAKASEYEGYSTLIKAEVSKYEAPKVAADVLRAETEGYAAKMRALVDAKNAEIKVREFPIEIFKAQIQAFQGQVQGVAEQLRAAVSVYETQARAFAEEVRASGYEVEGAVALLNAQTKIAEATGPNFFGEGPSLRLVDRDRGAKLFRNSLHLTLERLDLRLEDFDRELADLDLRVLRVDQGAHLRGIAFGFRAQHVCSDLGRLVLGDLGLDECRVPLVLRCLGADLFRVGLHPGAELLDDRAVDVGLHRCRAHLGLEDLNHRVDGLKLRGVDAHRLVVQVRNELLAFDLGLVDVELGNLAAQAGLVDLGAHAERLDLGVVLGDLGLVDLDGRLDEVLRRLERTLRHLARVGDEPGLDLPRLFEREAPIGLLEFGLLNHHVAVQRARGVAHRLARFRDLGDDRACRQREAARREVAVHLILARGRDREAANFSASN